MDLTSVDIKVPMEWWLLMAMLVASAAVTTFGVDAFARGWIKEGLIQNKKVIVFADIFAVALCVAAGFAVGAIIWNPVLSAAFGLLGSLGYKFFMKIIKAYLKKKGISMNGTMELKVPPKPDDPINDTLDLYSRAKEPEDK